MKNAVQTLRRAGIAVKSKAAVVGALALLALLQANVNAAAVADTVTVERVESLKLTIEAVFALLVILITASLGIRLYKKLGKRAIGSA
jgi:hypothetical protein